MFLEFYKLREQPFGVTPDPKYLYLSPTHREALASLYYGVRCGRGFMTLIAKPGMGKTTLLFRLLERLRDFARTAFLFQTQCNSQDLFRHLLDDLGINCDTQDVVELHRQLNALLTGEAQNGRRVVVIIDEAQNLSDKVLESVRLLSNFETPGAKLIQIILAGQPPLADKLASPSLVQLRQRLSVVARLEPFSPAETDRYIDYRLRVSGHVGEDLFSPEARSLIAGLSEGRPRDINNLCFNALSLGCALQKETIDVAIVREAASDLDVASLGGDHPASFDSKPIQATTRSECSTRTGQSALFRALVLAGKASDTGWPTRTGPVGAGRHMAPQLVEEETGLKSGSQGSVQ